MLDFSSLRSWLFVPGDSDRKIARSTDAGADALILDLEDSVPAAAKATARTTVAEAIRRFRTEGRSEALVVRVNALAPTQAVYDPISMVIPDVGSVESWTT